MANFEHLRFKRIISGDFKGRGGGGSHQRTTINKTNFKNHGQSLTQQANVVIKSWQNSLNQRKQLGLPDVPNAIPIFFQVDPKSFDADTLRSYGIEVIAEEEGGYIIGASSDMDLNALKQKIEKFIEKEGYGSPSKLWEIVDGTNWKIEHILSEELQEKWGELNEDDSIIVDVGIACYISIPDLSSKGKEETPAHYETRLNRKQQQIREAREKRDELAMNRQGDLERFVYSYEGEFIGSYIDLNDSFSTRIKISVKGLKDLVFNFSYLFEVQEVESLDHNLVLGDAQVVEEQDFELIPPNEDAPKVCVIDSGIQENHKFLKVAIRTSESLSYIPGNVGVADEYTGGGHGTRVAGAVLFSQKIPLAGKYQFPFWIQNARVLNEHCCMLDRMYPPALMREIVENFHINYGTRIFTLSVNSTRPYRTRHMSAWAATIDQLSWEYDIVFVVSAGNIPISHHSPFNPGITNHLANGRNYPNYLKENASRIANPGHSAQAITVGSICIDKFEDLDSISFGNKDAISPFSRIGLGIWGMIKPDFVHYGGDFIMNKIGNPNIRQHQSTSPELVRSTLNGGPAIGNDAVGTSFAVPKIGHILGKLQQLFPDENTLLYRALLAQATSLPDDIPQNAIKLNHIQQFGYGLPDIEKALGNNKHRITFIGKGGVSTLEAHIYQVKVPEELKRPGNRYQIKIEVTLSYKAIPRRTRRGAHSYLSNWLHWESNKIGEQMELFQERVLKNMSSKLNKDDFDTTTIPWTIKRRSDRGVAGVRLNHSTLQKDWCYLESNQLPDNIFIAVVGHKGWNQDVTKKVPYALAVSFEAVNKDVEIYNQIKVENEVEIEIEV